MIRHKKPTGEKLRDFILGAQDGIVNVLGLVLGVASATMETRTILIAGIAGLVAESTSMGAVSFTSSKAAHDYYRSVKKSKEEHMYEHPLKIGLFVLWATIFGSIVPLIPFFFMTAKSGMVAAVLLSAAVLFIIGSVKAKLTMGNWKRSGFEMLMVGMIAALIGYVVGIFLGKI